MGVRKERAVRRAVRRRERDMGMGGWRISLKRGAG
jgi:hypothetical protein